MENKERNVRALIGFVLGFFIGCGFSYLSLLLFNWAPLAGKEPVEITFGGLLPTGIFMGLAMAATMWSNPFGD